MADVEESFEIATGRRAGDGHVRVFLFTGSMLALSVEGTGERTPTLLLTLDQARSLQNALSALIPEIEAAVEREAEAHELAWQGDERRRQAS